MKSNIGHTQLSAGIAGFIKLVQSLRHGFIPQTLHASPVNALLPLDERKFQVASQAINWPEPTSGDLRHGAVSAFGFSGSNAHVVVREYKQPPNKVPEIPATLLLLSGRDAADLEDKCSSLAATLETNPALDLADVAYTLMTGRPAQAVRRAIVAKDAADAVKQLRAKPAPPPRRKALDDEQIGSVLALMPAQMEDIRASFAIALSVLANAFEQGCTTDERWLAIFVNRTLRRVKLPTTQYRTEDFWVGPATTSHAKDLVSFAADDPIAFEHTVGGKPLYPGTALLGALMAATGSTCLRGVSFETPLLARAHSAAALKLEAAGDERRLCTVDGTVVLKALSTREVPSSGTLPVLGETAKTIDTGTFYKRFSDAGLEYGPMLRGLRDIRRDGDAVEARIALQQAGHSRPGSSLVSAELLDMAFQCVAALTELDAPLPLMVPVGLTQITVLKPLLTTGRAVIRRNGATSTVPGISVDVWVLDDSGAICVLVQGLTFAALHSKAAGDGLLLLRPVWKSLPTPETVSLAGVTVLSNGEGPAEAAALLQSGKRHFVQLFRPGDILSAAMRGFWASAAKEYGDIRIALVETNTPDAAAQAYGLTVAGIPVVLRTQSGNWCERKLEPTDAAQTKAIRLAADDVILVTGGTGGIGRLLCQHLADLGAGTVIAAARRAHTGMQDGASTEWSCDLTKLSDVERMVSDVEKRFGVITGIAHCAGVADDQLITGLDTATVAATVEADVKIAGTNNLAACVDDKSLRFFLLFGGLVSEVGNRGQALYGYTNAYLSEFAEQASNRHCISWPLWSDGGMAMPTDVREHLEHTTGLKAMPAEVGMAALESAIASGSNQSVVLYGDTDKLQHAIGQPRAKAQSAETGVDTRSGALRQALVKPVLELLANSVSMQASDIDETMATADIDLDSLTVMSLKDDLHQSFGVAIAPSAFFEFRTIGAMIDRIAELGGSALADRLGVEARRVPAPPMPAPKTHVPQPAAQGETFEPARAIVPHPSRQEDIAIVGVDCRFPKADGMEAFWHNLLNGVDGISQVPDERAAEWRAVPESVRAQAAMNWGGFLTDIDQFDAAFFGISPAEAKLMDPQQRLLLQSVWRALEAAGYGPRSLGGSRTGVFVGCAGYDYANVIRQAGAAIEAFTPTGISPSLLANRLSHIFDFTGPSETLDTACASSLVALDHAVEAIRRGACEGAVVAAANLILLPDLHQAFCRAGLLSTSGACRTFDADADGYVRSEGVAALYLKPLSRAQADGDRIMGRILATAVNHGGKATSLTAPSPSQQAAVITDAWQAAGLEPDQIDYVEAHGTGTRLGDPVEISGLKMALSGPRWTRRRCADQPLVVGAVKSAIGHTEAVSGLAGVIKALQVVSTGVVPANLHLGALNPDIETAGTPLELASSRKTLRGEKLIAGVSSFGFGGTNAHVVIAGEPAPRATDNTADTSAYLIPLSARSNDDLRRRAQDMHTWLEIHAADTPQAMHPPAVDHAEVIAHITSHLSDMLHIPENAIDPDEAFAELGLDFLEMRQLVQKLSQTYPGALSRDQVTVENTVRDVAAALASMHKPLHAVADHRPAVSLAAIAYTLQTGRDAMACRHAFVCSSLQELKSALAAFLGGKAEQSGKSSNIPASVRRLLSGTSGPGLIRSMLADGDLGSLAAIWQDGVDIPWQALWADKHRPQKIELPAYTFTGARYWVDHRHDAGAQVAPSPDRQTYLRPSWHALAGATATPQSPTDLATQKSLGVLLEEVARLACAGEARLYRTADLATGMAVAALLRTAATEFARDCGSVLVDESTISEVHIPTVKPGSVLRKQATGFEVLGLEATDLLSGKVKAYQQAVILGGAGGLGLALAKHLARKGEVALTLVGRRQEDETLRDALNAVRALGAKVTYRSQNIADPQGMTALLQDIEGHSGRIDLIAHCAGIQDDQLLSSADRLAIERVLDAKVGGVAALRTAIKSLERRPLVVTFSSSRPGWAIRVRRPMPPQMPLRMLSPLRKRTGNRSRGPCGTALAWHRLRVSLAAWLEKQASRHFLRLSGLKLLTVFSPPVKLLLAWPTAQRMHRSFIN
nr:SDR family NAD(P)-dependent oxidoreductase [Kordiimonas gwangyangensis]